MHFLLNLPKIPNNLNISWNRRILKYSQFRNLFGKREQDQKQSKAEKYLAKYNSVTEIINDKLQQSLTMVS